MLFMLREDSRRAPRQRESRRANPVGPPMSGVLLCWPRSASPLPRNMVPPVGKYAKTSADSRSRVLSRTCIGDLHQPPGDHQIRRANAKHVAALQFGELNFGCTGSAAGGACCTCFRARTSYCSAERSSDRLDDAETNPMNAICRDPFHSSTPCGVDLCSREAYNWIK
jgi:hypothetical protein